MGPNVRYDQYGKLTALAAQDGWMMVRRPACVPFVIKVKDWIALDSEPPEQIVLTLSPKAVLS